MEIDLDFYLFLTSCNELFFYIVPSHTLALSAIQSKRNMYTITTYDGVCSTKCVLAFPRPLECDMARFNMVAFSLAWPYSLRKISAKAWKSTDSNFTCLVES